MEYLIAILTLIIGLLIGFLIGVYATHISKRTINKEKQNATTKN